jgi:hypothetical protein
VPFLPNLGRAAFNFFCTLFHHARSSAFNGLERASRFSGVSASSSANTFARQSYSLSVPLSARFISCCTASKSSRNIFSGHFPLMTVRRNRLISKNHLGSCPAFLRQAGLRSLMSGRNSKPPIVVSPGVCGTRHDQNRPVPAEHFGGGKNDDRTILFVDAVKRLAIIQPIDLALPDFARNAQSRPFRGLVYLRVSWSSAQPSASCDQRSRSLLRSAWKAREHCAALSHWPVSAPSPGCALSRTRFAARK